MQRCNEKYRKDKKMNINYNMVGAVTRKPDPPFLVSPGPNISKYLDPRIIYFNFAEIF